MACRALLISLVVAASVAALPWPSGATRTAAAADGPWRSSCTTSCGNISIAYPFGVEPGCYRGGFDVICDLSFQPPKLLLGDGATEVTDIFLSNGTLRIRSGYMNISDLVLRSGTSWGAGGLRRGGPYFLSEERNKLVVVACNMQVRLLVQGANANGSGGIVVSACSAVCPAGALAQRHAVYYNGGCSGVGCCQATVPVGYATYAVWAQKLPNGAAIGRTNILYIAERGVNITIDKDTAKHPPPVALPAVLDWVIGDANSTCPADAPAPECRSSHSYCQNSTAYAHRGYICRCSVGYEGNPYIIDGCQDVNECDHPEVYQCDGQCKNFSGTFECICPPGTHANPKKKGRCTKKSYTALCIGLGVGVGSTLIVLAVSVHVMKHTLKLHKARKMKEKFFEQNHGLLLQQLVSQSGDIAGRMIITLEELERATNNFDKTKEVGAGGHGTVYKGLLGLNVVAIKKSKIVIQKEIDDFINEVAILSQINHRNVVRLLGCCLETQVPLLVYEFISNGSLSHHLHTRGPSKLSWDDRLRIALEVARALAYLHSAASVPIFHRDIKSSNILLDDNLTAKVSDFGASRYISLNQTEVTASIQGTMGYVDPAYYYAGKLTDKSDVFSFGVLLIELLTREKPYIFTCNGDSLVARFHSLLMEGDLVQIIDPQVMEEEDGRIQEVAELGARCTLLTQQERPTMRQVEMELEILQAGSEKLTPRNAAGRRFEAYCVARPSTMANAGRSIREREEASRQYSMEEEILLSARYPR